MSNIYSVNQKTLEELIIKYLEIKTEEGIFTWHDLPPVIRNKIEELTDLLERYYGEDNLYNSF